MTARSVLRIGLALLAASQALVGVWALLAPRSFFDDFPAFGRTWVALLSPYNEHPSTKATGPSRWPKTAYPKPSHHHTSTPTKHPDATNDTADGSQARVTLASGAFGRRPRCC